MKGFFLPDGRNTRLMPGDQIIFTPTDNGPEIITFYRDGQRLFPDVPPHSLMADGAQYPRRLVHAERMLIAKLIGVATGTEVRVLELGEKRTIFQFI